MAERIDGKRLAGEVFDTVKNKAAELQKRHGIQPGLAVIIAGDNSASAAYVAAKKRRAEQCGIHSETIALPADISQTKLTEIVQTLNKRTEIHGILVQLPLPPHIDEQAVLQTISPEKDVDGLHYVNVGRLASGDASGLTPCTPKGIMLMLSRIHGKDLSGLDAVIVGRSNLVGKPAAAMLLAANATVTLAHTKTRELAEVVRSADILVVAAGSAELVKGSWIKPGATVIDVGITSAPAGSGAHTADSKPRRLIGDVEFDSAEIVAGHISPVPGGVGPMTIAMLMANTLKAACRACGEDMPDIS